MRPEEILEKKCGKETGFTVPEHYFEELNVRILSNLPPYPEKPVEIKMTRWQRVKPYVYLAAMFAGIWMMMNLFHRVATSDRLSLETPPDAIVQVIEAGGYDEMTYFPGSSEFELVEEVSDSYDSIDAFEKDFGYNLSPEYDRMETPS